MLFVNFGCVLSASSDLTVQNIRWDSQLPVFAGPLTLYVDIKNVGDGPSSNQWTLSLYVDDWLVGEIGPEVSPGFSPNQTQTWYWNISARTLFKDGDHQVKAAVVEPNDPNSSNNVLVKTLSISPSDYSNDFNIPSYGMCRNYVQNNRPANITDTYSLNDENVIVFFYTDISSTDIRQKVSNLTFNFYSPNGTLHKQYNVYVVSINRDALGRDFTIFTRQISVNKDYSGFGKPGDPLYDPGYQALNKYPGTWRVEVYNKGHLLFAKRFIIGEATTYIVSSTSSVMSSESTTLTATQTTISLPPTTAQTLAQVSGSQFPSGYLVAIAAIVVMCVAVTVVLVRRRATA